MFVFFLFLPFLGSLLKIHPVQKLKAEILLYVLQIYDV